MKVALHTCCGPCALEPFDSLAEAHDLLVVFANPNIQPVGEYERRRDTLLEWAQRHGVEVREVDYEPSLWDEAVEGVRHTPGVRCERCYELRLRQAASVAREAGCDALATTLSVSPYQDAEAIDRVGRAVAREAGLAWLFEDFRPRYASATQRSRDAGMYRQNYCGCLPSRTEAEQERAARRERRRRGS